MKNVAVKIFSIREDSKGKASKFYYELQEDSSWQNWVFMMSGWPLQNWYVLTFKRVLQNYVHML